MNLKMIGQIIILAACSGFTMSQNWKSCEKFIPEEYADTPIPNERELNIMCPGFLKYIRCYARDIDENIDKYEDQTIMFFYFLSTFVRELCTEGTQIRKDYLASHVCFRNVQDKFEECFKKAESFYEKYKNDTSNGKETPSDEKSCFTHGHAVKCMAHNIMKTCGPLEHSTYLQLVGRTKYLYKFCYDISTLQDLVSDYLELVKNEEMENGNDISEIVGTDDTKDVFDSEEENQNNNAEVDGTKVVEEDGTDDAEKDGIEDSEENKTGKEDEENLFKKILLKNLK